MLGRFLSGGVILLFNSCAHNNFKEFVGPALCPSNNFAFTTPYTVQTTGTDPTKVDFSNGQFVKINGITNETVTWSVKIKGTTSKAVKYYSGISSSIGGITWYGDSDSSTFFTTETCIVTLSVNCMSNIANTIVIQGKPTFDNALNKFVLITDCDGNGRVSSWYTYLGTSVTYDNYATVSDSLKSPQGGSIWKVLAATPDKSLTWFFGGFGNNSAINTSFSKFSLNPDSVYCNMYLSNNGTTNSQAQITIEDGVNKKTTVVDVNWSGWKMISFNMSGIVPNPRRISIIDIGLGAGPNQASSAELDVDFIIFTNGTPFGTDYISE